MTPEYGQVAYGSRIIEFAVERRDRKTLEIAVEPDLRVVIAAPLKAAQKDIDAKVKKRAAWILRQQTYFRQFLPRTPDRQYIAGETHLYLGRQYRLKVRAGLVDRVRLYRGVIDVETVRPKTQEHVKGLVQDWYRSRAKLKLQERLITNQDRFPSPDRFAPHALIIRKLSHRWGSMSPAGRLVLNTRLIEAPTDAIDYVITHELCHIGQPNHGPAFFKLLCEVMPDWEARKAKLERVMA
ncbi:MAG: SprT family zinc-dependent metalloprotease [Pseudomonadota bacterium]